MIVGGSVVRSIAGRDRGRLYLVLETDGVWSKLVDGRQRRADTPKRKKLRHAEAAGELPAPLAERFARGGMSNAEIRRFLAELGAAAQAEKAGPAGQETVGGLPREGLGRQG